MLSRKATGLMIIIALVAGIALTTSRCYDDTKARVTIHLQRNDLAYMGQPPVKHLIDKVLEFFSTRAEAVAGWDGTPGDLTLTISSSSFENMVFSIPAGATSYTATVPSTNDVTFEIISVYGGVKNWGGHTTINLGPGDQDITINMIPMVNIYSSYCCITLQWYDMVSASSYANGYYIYRSDNPNGPFAKIATVNDINQMSYNDSYNLVMDTTYYYKVSVFGPDGEGVQCDVVSALYNP